METGRLEGVDVEFRPHNREAIEQDASHPLIPLVEGDSVDRKVVKEVKVLIQSGERVLVVHDSDHNKNQVLADLNADAKLISKGSRIVTCDGIMALLASAPRSEPDWQEDNPLAAVKHFYWKLRSSNRRSPSGRLTKGRYPGELTTDRRPSYVGRSNTEA